MSSGVLKNYNKALGVFIESHRHLQKIPCCLPDRSGCFTVGKKRFWGGISLKFQHLLPALLLISIPVILLLWLLKAKPWTSLFVLIFVAGGLIKAQRQKIPGKNLKIIFWCMFSLFSRCACIGTDVALHPRTRPAAKAYDCCYGYERAVWIHWQMEAEPLWQGKDSSPKYISSLPSDVPVLVVTLSSAAL